GHVLRMWAVHAAPAVMVADLFLGDPSQGVIEDLDGYFHCADKLILSWIDTVEQRRPSWIRDAKVELEKVTRPGYGQILLVHDVSHRVHVGLHALIKVQHV